MGSTLPAPLGEYFDGYDEDIHSEPPPSASRGSKLNSITSGQKSEDLSGCASESSSEKTDLIDKLGEFNYTRRAKSANRCVNLEHRSPQKSPEDRVDSPLKSPAIASRSKHIAINYRQRDIAHGFERFMSRDRPLEIRGEAPLLKASCHESNKISKGTRTPPGRGLSCTSKGSSGTNSEADSEKIPIYHDNESTTNQNEYPETAEHFLRENALDENAPDLMLSELEERMRADYPECGTCQKRKIKCHGGFPECINCRHGGFICEPVEHEPKSPNNAQAQSLAGVGKRFAQSNSNANIELESRRSKIEKLPKAMSLHNDVPISLHSISPDDTETSFSDSFQTTSDEEDCDDYCYNSGYETSEDESLTKKSVKVHITESPRSGNESYEIIDWEDTNGGNTWTHGAQGSRGKRKTSGMSGGRNNGRSGQQSSGNHDDDGFGDDNHDRPDRRRKRPRGAYAGSSSEDERPFACPYHKYDPVKYHDCRLWSDSSLSRVKAHVLRTHLKPLQCDRCGSYQAGDQGQIRAHLRRGNCEKPKKFIPLAEKTIQKGNDLKKNSGKTRTWSQVFVVLFEVPESAVPSPYYTFESTQKTPAAFPRLPSAHQQPSDNSNSFSSIGSSLSNEGFEQFARDHLTRSLAEPLQALVSQLIAQELPNVIAEYKARREGSSTSSPDQQTNFSTPEQLNLPTPSNSYQEEPNFNQTIPSQSLSPREGFPHGTAPYMPHIHGRLNGPMQLPTSFLQPGLRSPPISADPIAYRYNTASIHHRQVTNNNTYHEPEHHPYPPETARNVTAGPPDINRSSFDQAGDDSEYFNFADFTFDEGR